MPPLIKLLRSLLRSCGSSARSSCGFGMQMFIEGLFHRFVEIEFVFGPDFRDGRRRRSLGEQGSREKESENELMFFHQSAFRFDETRSRLGFKCSWGCHPERSRRIPMRYL